MFKKGTKLNSILTGSCPQCQNESMYQEKNWLQLAKLLKMNDNCSHCGLKYQIEPSFFYGAMYVSYALNVAIGIIAFVIAFLVFKASFAGCLITIFVAIIVSYPIVLRLSRNIYINMFVDYKKD